MTEVVFSPCTSFLWIPVATGIPGSNLAVGIGVSYEYCLARHRSLRRSDHSSI